MRASGLTRSTTWLRRHWRGSSFVAAGLALPFGAAALAGGWYYAGRLEDGAFRVDHSPAEMNLRVVDVAGGRLTLESRHDQPETSDWWAGGIFGLAWDGGYAQVSTIRQIDKRRSVRDVRIIEGELKPDTWTRLDSFAYPGDPKRAHDLEFTDVQMQGELGTMPAWFVDAPGDVWAILVHGQGANRREFLRMLPAIHGAGLKALVITYRNDVEAPASANRRYGFGATEWRDVEVAAAYALEHGAKGLVLGGMSMGGGIVMSFLRNSAQAAAVRALILDAPMLDFRANVDFRSGGVPTFIARTGQRLASLRYGVDWDELDYLSRASAWRVPILLFHGDADGSVPVSTSDALAEKRPDLVTYVRLPGVRHVRSWNAGPEAYESAVSAFVAKARRGS